jgi:hypothetical protein
MQYTIIAYPDIEDLIKEVNVRIIQGWQPIGGVSAATQYREGTVFIQAMIKPRHTESHSELERLQNYVATLINKRWDK